VPEEKQEVVKEASEGSTRRRLIAKHDTVEMLVWPLPLIILLDDNYPQKLQAAKWNDGPALLESLKPLQSWCWPPENIACRRPSSWQQTALGCAAP